MSIQLLTMCDDPLVVVSTGRRMLTEALAALSEMGMEGQKQDQQNRVEQLERQLTQERTAAQQLRERLAATQMAIRLLQAAQVDDGESTWHHQP